MLQVLAVISVLVVAWTLGLLLYNLFTRRYDLLSWRNILLLGFMHFFGIGSYFTALYPAGTEFYAAGPGAIAAMSMALPAFLLVFMLACRFGARWRGLRRLLPPLELPITAPGLLISIVVLTTAGLIGSLIPMGSYIAAFVVQFKGGLTATATGLATYFLIARRFNPIAWMVFFGTLGAALLIGTVGSIERRSTIGVILAVGWMWWYFSLRERGAVPTLIRLGSLGAVGVVVLLAYAGIRGRTGGGGASGFGIGHRSQQITELIKNPTIAKGSVQNMLFSDTPPISMFIIENYPDPYPYVPFHGALYILSNPIPRSMWPGKPEGMAVIVEKQMKAQANLGIGIIGHGWAEGGWVGVLGYAAFFGFAAGAVDSLIRRRAWNPYFVSAIGSCLGQLVAVPRGETSLFFLLVMAGFIGTAAVLYFTKLLSGAVMAAAPPVLTPVNAWIAEDSGGEEEQGFPEDQTADEFAGVPATQDAW